MTNAATSTLGTIAGDGSRGPPAVAVEVVPRHHRVVGAGRARCGPAQPHRGRRPPTYRYAVAGDAPDGFEDALDAVAAQLDVEFEAVDVAGIDADDPDTVARALDDDELDAVVRIDPGDDMPTGVLVTREEPSAQLVDALDLAWRTTSSLSAATSAGLTGDELEAVLNPPPLAGEVLEPDDDDDPVALLTGFVAAILLFLSISMFGGTVLTGVVEEKSTGVVEVLLAHLRPHQLLIGKVFGITVVALVQFAAAVLAGVVALVLSGRSVPGDVWVALPSSVGWFVGGFVLYSTLFALAGSFVSRQEDAQGAAAPVTAIAFAAYLAVFSLGMEPASTATRIVSLLPPFAPLLMPLRMATGSAGALDVALAAILLVAAVYGMLRLTGAVYGRTMLHRGARLRWREALRIARSRDHG
ncbi:MAG: ABC transporter permease [Ilumatobacteraceae bacterium]